MSVLTMVDQTKIDPGFSVAENPVTNFTDVFVASIESTARNYLTTSKQFFVGRETGARNDAYKAVTGRSLEDDAINASPDRENLLLLKQRNIARTEIRDAVDNYVANLRQQDPEKYKDVVTSTEIEERVKTKAKESLARAQKAEAGATPLAGTAGSLAGGMVASLADPVNLATIPLSAGLGVGILKTALIEAGVNAGTELVTQPIVAEWQRELGVEYGFKEMAENVGMAALFGGAFGAGAKTIELGFGRAKSAAMAELSARLDEADNPLARRVAQLEERRFHLQESNPARLADDLDGRTHLEALREVDAAINEGRGLNAEKLKLSDDQVRALDPKRMDEGLAAAHARIVEADTLKNREDLNASAGRINETHEVFRMDRPEAPTLERQRQVEELYSSPEWKAKESSNFDERFNGKTDDRVFMDDGMDDLSVDEIRKAFESDAAFLETINTCGLGG